MLRGLTRRLASSRFRSQCSLCYKASHSSIPFSKTSHSSILSSKALAYRLSECSSQAPHSYSLQQYLDVSQSKASLYNLVRSELQVRLAELIVSLPRLLPNRVKDQRTAQFIQDYYEMSFRELEDFPITISTKEPFFEDRWLEVLTRIGIRLGGITEMLSDAILTSGALTHPDTYDHLQLIVPKILSKNISADFLVNVYKPKWVTYVSLPTFILTNNDILKDAEAAYEDARYLCEQHYISSPSLEVDKGSNVNTIFPSIPNYNYLILFEIFKNAMRATMEEHGEDNEESPPPVMLRVREDGFRLVIEVVDKGGGMSEEQQIKAMKFFSSTAVLADMSTYQGAISSPLAGHGFGLGVARLYCCYWGGDLNIRARKGSGATVRMEWCTEPALASENF